jgi:ppGpp synthetase/RelA/SpoT-type nucleotidyltranferase
MIQNWKPTATKAARRFLYEYSQEHAALQDTARLAERLITSIIKPEHLEIHQVAARVKSLDSMRLKLRRKCYQDPECDVTDKIGVRVITYYMDEVDRVADLLKLEFEIDKANSEDKRTVLETSAFGYRSVHLIARLRGARLSSPEYMNLRGRWFEIQVRSLLEHAWAEIEHEVKYKPRVDYPVEITRRFARIAGVLEFLDSEFLSLRHERAKLIDSYREAYAAKKDYDVPFDSARLLGFLEAARPDGFSWARARSEHKPFPLHIEASCVDALTTLKLNTPRRLKTALARTDVKRQFRRFAEIARVDPSEISHLAIILLLVLTISPSRLTDLFPLEACNSSELREMRRAD